MTTRLLLTVNYKQGNFIKTLVHYVYVEDGTLFYSVDRQVSDAAQMPVGVPLKHVSDFTVEKVCCDGWSMID